MKWFIVLLATISGLFGGNVQPPPIPLNTAIISYTDTYYVPAVAEPGNFPWAKKVIVKNQSPSELTLTKINKQTLAMPAALPPAPVPAVVTPPASSPSLPPQDPYLAIPEPIVDWFNLGGGLTLKGTSQDGIANGGIVALPEITFDREYWKLTVDASWAPNVPNKSNVQNDFFKLEVYEKRTDKLIYTMSSGLGDGTGGFYKSQAFRKPGTYYFKVYTKDPSSWEMNFMVSLKLAQ